MTTFTNRSELSCKTHKNRFSTMSGQVRLIGHWLLTCVLIGC